MLALLLTEPEEMGMNLDRDNVEKTARLTRHSLDLAYAEACALRGLFATLPPNQTTGEMQFHLERLASQLVEMAELTSAFTAPVRAGLLRAIREERGRFFAAVGVPSPPAPSPTRGEGGAPPLPPALLPPVSTGATRGEGKPWTLKDLVGHIVAWEVEAAARLELIARGREDEIVWIAEEEVDDWNAREAARRLDWSWERVTAEADDIGDRLLAALAALSEEQITGANPPVDRWLNHGYIPHYAQHLADIEKVRG